MSPVSDGQISDTSPMELENARDTIYRWHQLMWRLDEVDELSYNGVVEDEAVGFETERAAIREELAKIEAGILRDDVTRLHEAHATDRAYREQLREMEEGER
jgi:hypothetical protein